MTTILTKEIEFKSNNEVIQTESYNINLRKKLLAISLIGLFIIISSIVALAVFILQIESFDDQKFKRLNNNQKKDPSGIHLNFLLNDG